MEDLLQVQEDHNKEFQKQKMERLLTSDGRKSFVKEKLGDFINKVLKDKNYQVIFGLTISYIILTGVWYTFVNLFTVNTIILISVCLLVTNYKHLIKIKDYIRGIFRKKK